MMNRRTIAILNPNATASMTDDMVELAGRDLPPGVSVIGLTNAGGPPAIQGPEDAAACLPGLMSLFGQAERQGVDAVIIGCFDDTGLDRLRRQGGVPVVGLGEAGCMLAALAAPRFHVVTTMQGSVPVIEENIRAMGLAHRCASVRASGVPVLELGARVAEVDAAIAAVLAGDPRATIVLGCAGMSRIAPSLRTAAEARLIDPVRAALGLAAGVIAASVAVSAPAPA
jgi:allantoin racemase